MLEASGGRRPEAWGIAGTAVSMYRGAGKAGTAGAEESGSTSSNVMPPERSRLLVEVYNSGELGLDCKTGDDIVLMGEGQVSLLKDMPRFRKCVMDEKRPSLLLSKDGKGVADCRVGGGGEFRLKSTFIMKLKVKSLCSKSRRIARDSEFASSLAVSLFAVGCVAMFRSLREVRCVIVDCEIDQ